MQIIYRLNCLFDRETKIKLILLLIAIIIGALLETLALSIISPFIAILMDNTVIQTNRYAKLVYDLLGFYSVTPFLALLTFLLAAVYIFRGIYLYIISKTQYRFLARRQANLSDRLLRKILGFSYLYHSGKNIAELHRIIIGDVSNMFTLITSILLLLTDLFMTLFIALFLFIVSPIMTFSVMLMALVSILLFVKVFRQKIRLAGDKVRDASIGMSKAVNQSLGGIKEVKVLRREGYFHHAFKLHSNIYVKANTEYRALDAVPKLVIESVCFGGAFILVGAFIASGADIAGLIPQLSVFVLAAFRLLPAISRLVNQLNQIIFYHSSVDAVYKSLFEEEDNLARTLPPVTDLPSSVHDIIISGVTFQYPSTPLPVLEKVSLVIPENKSVAFIGSSGAGKTTLADLILGILTPLEGGVFYNGNPIHLSSDEWSKSVGYIPQQIYLLDETIRENVAFGIDKSKIDETKIWRALEQAQLREFVESLPNGLNSVVGDRGIRLSGGQRQRIGIARAMYEDPPILVLDEATSSLDNETEKAVMDAVMGFQGNKTMLIVAHRLSTIEHCDVVYRVDNHTVVREK